MSFQHVSEHVRLHPTTFIQVYKSTCTQTLISTGNSVNYIFVPPAVTFGYLLRPRGVQECNLPTIHVPLFYGYSASTASHCASYVVLCRRLTTKHLGLIPSMYLSHANDRETFIVTSLVVEYIFMYVILSSRKAFRYFPRVVSYC